MLLHFPVILPAQPVLRFAPIVALAATFSAAPADAPRPDRSARNLAERLMNHQGRQPGGVRARHGRAAALPAGVP